MEIITRSTITCPECGFGVELEMPVNACQYFFTCSGCGASLKPKAGDCCIFCSYGSVKCPPVQQDKNCCRYGVIN
jgi:hypothetical protein